MKNRVKKIVLFIIVAIITIATPILAHEIDLISIQSQAADADFPYSLVDYLSDYDYNDIPEIKEILDEIKITTKGMSDFEKIVYVHDYLALNLEYDKSLTIRDIYTTLTGKTAVCAGYARAYKMIVNELDIECIYVYCEERNHVWNMVKLDGEWYHVDCTLDDYTNAVDGKCSRYYLLANDDQMAAKAYTSWEPFVRSTSDKYVDMPRYTNLTQSFANNSCYYWLNGNLYTCDQYGNNQEYICKQDGDAMFVYKNALYYADDSYIKSMSLKTLKSSTIGKLEDTSSRCMSLFVENGSIVYFYDKSSNFNYENYSSSATKSENPIYLGDTQVELTSYTATTSEIELNWNEVYDADGYRIYQFKDGEWINIKTLSGKDSTDYLIDNLDEDTTYKFKVKAYYRDTQGNARWYDASDTFVTQTKSTTVQMTTYSSVANAIRINWEEVCGADGYRVYQLTNGSWKSIKTLSGGDITTYRVEDLESDTTYEFKVKAFYRNSKGVAKWYDASDAFIATTKATTVKMTTYSKTTTAIRINWEEVYCADGYRVYMFKDGSWVKIKTLSGKDTTTYRVEDLESDTTYKFKVKAYYRDSNGVAKWFDASDTFVTQTRSTTVQMTTYSSVENAIRINWESVYGADGYRVYQLTNGSWKSIKTLSGGDITTYRVEDLESDTTYEFKVKAFYRNSNGVAKWYDASDAFIATTKPITVEITDYSSTTSAIRLNWERLESADGYRVSMYIDGTWNDVKTIESGDTTTYRIDGLDSGTIYQFKIKAFEIDSQGNMVWTELSSAYSAMTRLEDAYIGYWSWSYGSSTYNLTFIWSEVENATGYKIYQFVDNEWKTVGSTEKTYYSCTLDNDSTYQFKVKAFSKALSKTVWGEESSVFEFDTY